MVRCKHCGAENYAIDMWCSNCSHHLDWTPAATAAVQPSEPAPAAAVPSEPEPAAAVPSEPEPAAAVPTESTAVAAVPLESEPVSAVPAQSEPVAAVAPQAEPAAALPPGPEPASPAAPVAAAALAAPHPRTEPAVRTTSRRKASVWILPLAAAAVVALLLAMPVLGWFKAAGQRDTAQLPLTGLNSFSPSASPTAIASPTPEATPQPTPAATDQPSAQPDVQPAQPPVVVQQPAPVPAAQSGTGDPRGSIAGFYQAVASHQFDAAAATWSARMQSAYPPPQYINQRFAYTQQMNLRQARVVANNGQTATVYIDLIEIYAGSTRHWVGTWQLVNSSSGWLLNQPNLRAAS